jgi:hypothetical protein
MVHKHFVSAEIGFGHSFPDYDAEDKWKGVFYPGIQTSLGYKMRLTRNWEIDSKFGLSSYMLVNKSSSGRYIFDFASPSLEIGANYVKEQRKFETFINCNLGSQLGYSGSVLTETFTNYTVHISPKRFYFFLRLEIGLRKSFSSLKSTYEHEIGTFFRYNFTKLGTVQFIGSDYIVNTSPSGNLIGFFYRFNMNIGRKMIKIKKTIEQLPRF